MCWPNALGMSVHDCVHAYTHTHHVAQLFSDVPKQHFRTVASNVLHGEQSLRHDSAMHWRVCVVYARCCLSCDHTYTPRDLGPSHYLPLGTPCRASAGVCDLADVRDLCAS
jgi:hypothetical protein